jgi:glutamate-1-semialdehyde 2,1-aminomutase
MITAILQARMGSTRLPGKSMKGIGGKPMLWHVLRQLKGSKLVDTIVVATTVNPADDEIEKLADASGVKCFRGSEEDVLERYTGAVEKFGGDIVVRVTADCPLLDAGAVDQVIADFLKGRADYVSNVHPPTFPDGLDVEVFSRDALMRAGHEAKLKSEREHVTPYIWKNAKLFRQRNVINGKDLSALRWTVDTPEDLEFVKAVYRALGKKAIEHSFGMRDVLDVLAKNPGIAEINKKFERNEGYAKSLNEDKEAGTMNKGVELWNKAKKIIPGGNQLLSKRSEMLLPDQWPSYYSRAKGIEVWGIDGKKYTDMTTMSVGACILGYADDDVNAAVISAVKNGSISTLNCPEEVELAEKLLQLNPWAGGVRYARTAGEALTVAVRIARAHTKKDKVAFCGYHGWHDWYLAANLANEKSLDGHLLPGLHPLGVPRGLTGTSIPFEYNKAEQLEAIMEKNEDVGTIVLEPMRHNFPKKEFVDKVQKIAADNGAVLLIDEVTSGWRMRVGGVYEMVGIKPDLAVYGKAMSNGYPMAAIIGKSEVMDAAQASFISSTYWTERVGPVAALATIAKLEKENVPAHLRRIGRKIGEGWDALAKEKGLGIEVLFDFEPLITFGLSYKEKSQAISTLFTQEMLERGYLASRSIYVSNSHKDVDVDRYMGQVEEVFTILKKAIDEGSVEKKLKGPVAHEGFKRLTA